jgi:hypothetical protein
VIHDQTGLGERESQAEIYERYKTHRGRHCLSGESPTRRFAPI